MSTPEQPRGYGFLANAYYLTSHDTVLPPSLSLFCPGSAGHCPTPVPSHMCLILFPLAKIGSLTIFCSMTEVPPVLSSPSPALVPLLLPPLPWAAAIATISIGDHTYPSMAHQQILFGAFISVPPDYPSHIAKQRHASLLGWEGE